jgi:tRNA/tmRNA/rRNA uracil-C5-methylase (TrmA/RlmC/RlmD family)
VSKGPSRVGERIEVEVGPIAHGGHCVARVPTGPGDGPGEPARDRVVFVRHALPGERVVVEVTEGGDGDSFWRADAVEVLEASSDRVPPPCHYAQPGGCGGCDFQHVAPAAQRAL